MSAPALRAQVWLTAGIGTLAPAVALSLGGGLLAAALAQPVWDTSGGDDGMYVMLAWSLRHGLGYVHQVGVQHIPHSVWPPGFPAMLAAVLAAWPPSAIVPPELLRALKVVPVVAYAWSILLVWWWVRNVGGSALAALGIAALFLLHPGAIAFSQLLRSELPYTVLSLGALIAVERALLPAERGDAAASRSAQRHGLILLLTLAAAYTRPIGIALLLAWLVRLLLARRFRLMLLYGAAGGLVLLPWLLWVQHNTMDDHEAMRYLTRSHLGWLLQQETGSFDVVQRSPVELPLWALSGLGLYAGHSTPHLLVQSRLPLEPVAGVAVTALLVVGGFACWQQGSRATCLYLLIYVGILLLWEERTNRLFVPVLPLLLFFTYQGLLRLQCWLRTLAGRVTERLAAQRTNGATVVAVVMLLVLGANYLRVGMPALGKAYACGGAAGCLYPPAWNAFLVASDWLRQHATREDIVLSTEPVKLRLASGVAAVPYVPLGADGADELFQAIARWRVTYIVEDAGLYAAPSARLASSELRRSVARLPGVEKVWEDPVTGTRVWRLAS